MPKSSARRFVQRGSPIVGETGTSSKRQYATRVARGSREQIAATIDPRARVASNARRLVATVSRRLPLRSRVRPQLRGKPYRRARTAEMSTAARRAATRLARAELGAASGGGVRRRRPRGLGGTGAAAAARGGPADAPRTWALVRPIGAPVRGFAADANAEPAKDPDDDRVVDLDREEFPDVSPRVIRLADDICSLTLLEVHDMTQILSKRLGIPPSRRPIARPWRRRARRGAPAAAAAPRRRRKRRNSPSSSRVSTPRRRSR